MNKPVYSYEKLRYGFFVHYIADLQKGAEYKDGSRPGSYDEAADNFDVPGFAEALEQMQVEYLIFTSWHFRMIPLYPSEVTAKWRPDCCIRRDLLGEIIDAVRAKGIRVILYTHPRDGHDFTGPERTNCGWSVGEQFQDPQPDSKTFDYDKWNAYSLALYQELLDRYGTRIDAVYTDGAGPGGMDADNCVVAYQEPVINYLKIREIVKTANPDLAIVQNGFGPMFSDDFIMPEGYFGMEERLPVGRWPACEKALAMTPFTGWVPSGKYGEDVRRLDPADIARFTIFQATCNTGGGTCWASGPYCGGGWDVGVVETMREVGRHMTRIGEAVKNIVPSTSWPTVSGDSLESRGWLFACSSDNRRYEYIHIMRMPDNGVIQLPAPEDGAQFACPRPMTPGMRITDFTQDASGVSFRLSGTPDELDTVVRLTRENNERALTWYWLNDTDKRVCFSRGDWAYRYIGEMPLFDGEKSMMEGCFEYDTRLSKREGAYFDICFEGEYVEIYGVTGPEGCRAQVVIDDVLAGEIDTHAPVRRVRQLLYRSDRLFGGTHRICLYARGEGTLEFDAARIGG